MLLHSSKPLALGQPVPTGASRCPERPRGAPLLARPALTSFRSQYACCHVLQPQLAHHAQQRRRVTVAARNAGPGDLDDELGEDDDIGLDFTDETDEFGAELLDALAGDNPDEFDASGIAAQFQDQGEDDSLFNFIEEQGFMEDEFEADLGKTVQLEAGLQPPTGEQAIDDDAPGQRVLLLAHLFHTAAFYDVVDMLEEKYPEVVISGLQSDASRVQPGDMFCCTWPFLDEVPAMIEEALQRGAAALLLPEAIQGDEAVKGMVPDTTPTFFVESVEEAATRFGVAFYEAPSRDMLMIGVVGTHGKTTTAWLLRGILEEMEQVAGMMSSIENAVAEVRLDEDGGVWVPGEPDNTAARECSAPFMITPYKGKYVLPDGGLNGLQTQKVLCGMRDQGATCCVYEASPELIASRTLSWVEAGVVVHTCLLPPAGDSPMTSAQEKDEQLRQMVEAALEPFEKLEDATTQAVVINLDDSAAALVREAAHLVPAVTYSYDNPSADVVCESATFDIWESEVIVRTPLGRLQIITSLLGKHNVYNILAAVAAGIALKVPLKSIVAGIEAVEVIPGRCEIVDEGQDFSVIVDAADTPQGLSEMLNSVKGKAKRIITVFGCKGEEEDRSKRALMAEVAHQLSDIVIVTNDSPRREAPDGIVQDIVAGLPDSVIKRYSGYVYFPFQDQGHVPLWFEPYLQKAQMVTQRYIMEDRFSAIRAAIGTAAEGDVVVLAGRGHSDCMEYGGEEGEIVRGWFDDRVEARSALGKLAYLNQLTKLSRANLPWGKALEEMDSLIDPPMPVEAAEEDESRRGAAV